MAISYLVSADIKIRLEVLIKDVKKDKINDESFNLFMDSFWIVIKMSINSNRIVKLSFHYFLRMDEIKFLKESLNLSKPNINLRDLKMIPSFIMPQ